jgi:hypothetical protein
MTMTTDNFRRSVLLILTCIYLLLFMQVFLTCSSLDSIEREIRFLKYSIK